MNATTIITTAFPMVVAILTIYFNNFFSERSKRQDFFRNKKHEHIPHIYKEVRVIYKKFSKGVSIGDEKGLLPPNSTDIKNVTKYLEILGLAQEDIATIEDLWRKDYQKASEHFNTRVAENNIQTIEKRVEELHEYWLSVALYLKPSLNNEISTIYDLFKECIYYEYMLVWTREDINDPEFVSNFTRLRKRIESLYNKINNFHDNARKFLESK